MESVVNDKVFIDEKSNYSASLISEDYYEDIDVVYRTKPNNIMRLDDDFYTQLKDVCLNDLGMNHSFSKVIEYNNEEYIVKFLSIKNIVNHHVGYLVSTSKTDDYKSIVNDFYKQSLFITLFTTMIIMFGWSTARNHNKLKVVSQNDQLTRIYNRHMFTELTEKELKRSNRYGYSSCILLMDIDHFKKINDTYGHNGGDQALRDLAALVSSNIRDTDIFARWGGEEFIFMLPQTDLNSGIVFAEKIRVLIENSHEGPLNDITVSIGISVVPSTCTNLKDYIDFADEAMYQAKKSGRNRVCHT